MNPLPQPTSPPAQDSLILVVDDVQQNIQVVGAMLREAGYSIMPATNGATALQRVARKLPDLILLDLMMPEMDGLEVCRRLKADAATAQVPIIFLTASNEMAHLVQGLQAGAVDYVTKPFNPPELLARVRTHLELKHSRDTILRYTAQLRALNEEKNELMGIVAHDLRNPLGAIQGYAEMLLEEPRMEPQELHETAGRIREITRRMTEMVRDLLDANAIERGELKLNLRPVELGALARGVVDTFQSQASAKQQGLALAPPPGTATSLADSDVMVQVLENLVSNAIKYSPRGKNIWVWVKRTPDAAQCVVQDEGPGLTAEDQKRVFGKFARLSAKPTAGENSTGLGLSIVKRMVESMGGKVWCESHDGKGATFVVQLRASP